jgi:hypothetical protein
MLAFASRDGEQHDRPHHHHQQQQQQQHVHKQELQAPRKFSLNNSRDNAIYRVATGHGVTTARQALATTTTAEPESVCKQEYGFFPHDLLLPPLELELDLFTTETAKWDETAPPHGSDAVFAPVYCDQGPAVSYPEFGVPVPCCERSSSDGAIIAAVPAWGANDVLGLGVLGGVAHNSSGTAAAPQPQPQVVLPPPPPPPLFAASAWQSSLVDIQHRVAVAAANAQAMTMVETLPQNNDRAAGNDKKEFRKVGVMPPALFNAEAVGSFHVRGYAPEVRKALVEGADAREQAVRSGAQTFGEAVYLKSFVDCTTELNLAATYPNILFMSALCSKEVMQTDKGKVSVYPCTIFNNKRKFATRKDGVPCLAIHKSHMKVLLWRMYSASRAYLKTDTFAQQLGDALCEFDSTDDHALLAMSGLEPFNNVHQRKNNGFMLLTAHYVDVMRHFFLDHNNCLKDVGSIFRAHYHPNSALGIKNKFDDTFRCVWLGDEREVEPNSILKDCNLPQNMAQTRLRAHNNTIRIGVNGRKWILPATNTKNITYNVDAYAYGVECWDKQLSMLNTMYSYYTGVAVSGPTHMQGLFVLEEPLLVKTKNQCVRQGIFNKTIKVESSKQVRRQRRKLTKDFGSLANFWGETRSYKFTDDQSPSTRRKRVKV